MTFFQRSRGALGAAIAFSFLFGQPALAETTIRVISDRTPSHLEPLFEQYEQGAGVTIEAVFVDDGLLSRLQARPTEADVVITSTADILEAASAEGLLGALPDGLTANVREEFRDQSRSYVITSVPGAGDLCIA